MSRPAVLTLIEELFVSRGHIRYPALQTPTVNAQGHALQCAQLAEWAHAEPELIAAALLHDLGHMLDAGTRQLGTRQLGLRQQPDEGHETRALPLLRSVFPEAVTEPIRLHVQAKRYLVSFDRQYLDALSPAALHGLSMQGGPMSPLEMRQFELEPHAGAAIKLRIWDDLAQHPGKTTPPLDHYLDLLAGLVQDGRGQGLSAAYRPARMLHAA